MAPAMWTQTCAIDDVARVADGQGGWTRSFGPELIVGRECKFDALAGSAPDVVATGRRSEVSHVLFIDVDAPVAPGRRVRISTGEVAEILAVRRPGGSPVSFDPHLEVDCRELRGVA